MGLGVAKDVGMTGLFVEGLETVRVFSVVWRGRLQKAFDQDMIACMKGVKGQLCVWKRIVVLSPVCLSVCSSGLLWLALTYSACPDRPWLLYTHAKRQTLSLLLTQTQYNRWWPPSMCFSWSVSYNWTTVVRPYSPVGLSICVCLSVHHRIPAVFPAEFPLTLCFLWFVVTASSKGSVMFSWLMSLFNVCLTVCILGFIKGSDHHWHHDLIT